MCVCVCVCDEVGVDGQLGVNFKFHLEVNLLVSGWS